VRPITQSPQCENNLGKNFSMAALGKYSCSCVKAKNTLKRICTMKRVKGEGCVNDRTINGIKNSS
jgi:hypothetical protein